MSTWRLTIQSGLKHLVTEDAAHLHLSAEASDLGAMTMPAEIEYQSIVYRYPRPQRDQEGELFAMEYTNGRMIFTLWND